MIQHSPLSEKSYTFGSLKQTTIQAAEAGYSKLSTFIVILTLES